jgi:hypothetical protein
MDVSKEGDCEGGIQVGVLESNVCAVRCVGVDMKVHSHSMHRKSSCWGATRGCETCGTWALRWSKYLKSPCPFCLA